MTKTENIFILYFLLNNDGAKGDAIAFIADLFGISINAVKVNWMTPRQFPNYIENPKEYNKESIIKKLDEIIKYLQNAIKQQNSK